MSLANDIEALQRLRSDSRLVEIGNYVPPLSLFRMFGMVRDELAHSRMIASLLDPRRHRNYERILRPLLHDVSLALDRAESTDSGTVYRVADALLSRVAVRRELFRIDIVIEVDSPAGDIVLGIENKIDADEQPDQIARYQDALSRAYPDRTAIMVFLCPEARAPFTASQASKVPVVEIGYRAVVSAITSALEVAEPDSRDSRALEEVARHIEEDILSSTDDIELRRTVGDLWKDHGRALSLVALHRPRLADVQKRYVEIIREHLGKDAEFSYFPGSPRSREFREIKIQLTSWKKIGFPFIFMFYLGRRSGVLRVRVLFNSDGHGESRYSYTALQSKLQEWARWVNESNGPMVDEAFAPIRSWTEWRRILSEEDFPQNSTLDEQSFDEASAQEAAQRVIALVELLRPYVEEVDQ